MRNENVYRKNVCSAACLPFCLGMGMGMEGGNENKGCCMIPYECLPALVDKGNREMV